MNIIITGANGYLGSNLVKQLSSPQMDNFNYKLLLIIRNESLLPNTVINHKNIQICNVNSITFYEQIAEFSPDVIFSATCCYENDGQNLDKTVDANYVFPCRVLQIAATLKKKIRFISIGTSLPPSLNLYSLTKKHFAELGAFFGKAGRIEFINVLLESFYGINEPRSRFITKSIIQLKTNQDILLTEGNQTRDYIYIDDVIEILFFLIDCNELELLAGSDFSIPVGSGIAPTIRDIILFLSRETGSESNLKFGAIKMRDNEPSTKADISILRMLGFSKPIMHWQEGMRKVIGSLE